MEEPLKAPLSGWSMPLREVPDALFASGGAGLGQAIDPVGQHLAAPCAGEVIQIHRCRHALTLRREDGVEILMHLGIDSVALKGEGFRVLVQVGERVQVGDPLIEFDADLVAQRARSLVSVILIQDHPRLLNIQARCGRIRQGEEWLSINLAEASPQWLRLPNPGGLHARPAARLVQLVRELPGEIYLESRRARASARSIVALLSLDLSCGDLLRVVASDLTPNQLNQLESQILEGLGDLGGTPPPHIPPPVVQSGEKLAGVIAARGLAVGPVQHWQRPRYEVPQSGGRSAQEERSWQKALRQAATGIEELFARAPLQQRGIFAAHREILQDPSLQEKCRQGLSEGHSAAWSWQRAYQSQADLLASLANPVLAARANDVRDVGERVLRYLLELPPMPPPPKGCILLARDLYPSEILQIDRSHITGLCLAEGFAGDHLSVLVRGLEIPTLCNLGPTCLELTPGTRVLLDADQGLLWTQPSAEQLAEAEGQLEGRARQQLAVQEPALTKDHQRIHVGLHNQQELPAGADFLIQSSHNPVLASALGPQRRLLLKLSSCAPIPEVLACSAVCRLGLLLGMMTSLAAWRTARGQLQSWAGQSTEIGLLVDAPATALLADHLAPEADLLVIDMPALVNHTLALERARPELLSQADPLHPSLLKLMHRVARACTRHGKPLILYQAASDREALPLWLGLPIDHLTVESTALAATKAEIRNWSRSACQELLTQAQQLAEAEEVRQLVRQQGARS